MEDYRHSKAKKQKAKKERKRHVHEKDWHGFVEI
jgi:hypothetical protein